MGIVSTMMGGEVWAQVAPVSQPTSTETPAAEPLRLGASEWTVAAVTGWGVPVFGYGVRNSFSFPAVSWSRVLTGSRGRSWWRGQFEWGVELVPFFAQYNPRSAYGLGVSPLVWRWNLEPGRRLSPFAELGGGVLWTNVDVPSNTTRANYTAHVTLAARLLGDKRRGAIVGYRFEHISNGNRVDPNPSVNAHAIVVGWSLFRM
ncbi:MAG: acyloxyacyl hydrolase [Acidobacteria bacterium]|nr:acyloxyacyl hydrolase [Acidobacteriota bacterium]